MKLVLRRDIQKRALIVAILVGTLLNMINQGDAIVANGPIIWTKIGLTYLVPYCVAIYGAVSAISSQRRD